MFLFFRHLIAKQLVAEAGDIDPEAVKAKAEETIKAPTAGEFVGARPPVSPRRFSLGFGTGVWFGPFFWGGMGLLYVLYIYV